MHAQDYHKMMDHNFAQHYPHSEQSTVNYLDRNWPNPSIQPLPSSATKLIQCIIGIFLYYALALYFTMLVALGTLASQQSAPTTQTWDDIMHFLVYAVTYPSAVIRFKNPI